MRLLLFLAGTIALAVAQDPTRFRLYVTTGSGSGAGTTDGLSIIVRTMALGAAVPTPSASTPVVLTMADGTGSVNLDPNEAGYMDFDLDPQVGYLVDFSLTLGGTDDWSGSARLQEHQDCQAVACAPNYFNNGITINPDPLINVPADFTRTCTSKVQFVGCCDCDHLENKYKGRAASCHEYSRCTTKALQRLNNFFETPETRSCGTLFYNQYSRTCDFPENVMCDRDRCRDPSFTDEYYSPGLGMCHVKCRCAGGRTVECTCCGVGFRTDAVGTCQADAGCIDSVMCPGPVTTYVPPPPGANCPYLAIPSMPQYYREMTGGLASKVRRCAPKTVYDASLCGCRFHVDTDATLGADVCTATMAFTFQNTMVPLGLKRGSVRIMGPPALRPISQNNMASFRGRGKVRLVQFASSGLGNRITIMTKYLIGVYNSAPANQLDTLVSNENCKRWMRTPASVSITHRRGTAGAPGNEAIVATIRAQGGGVVELEVDAMPDAQANDVELRYGQIGGAGTDYRATLINKAVDGNVLNAVPTDAGTMSAMEGGNILKTGAALRLGKGCGASSYFVGNMDEFSIYRCFP